MKLSVILFLSMAAVAFAKPADKYTTKFDNVDLDEILKSDRLTENYVNCLLDKRPCTPAAQELKGILPDALKSKCSKCNQRQQDGARKVIRHLYNNKKNWWNQLEAKYDPEHTYVTEHEAELKAL